jgi:hypothetical protein
MAKFCVGPDEEERGGVGYSCNEMRAQHEAVMAKWHGTFEYARSCLSPSIKNWISFIK